MKGKATAAQWKYFHDWEKHMLNHWRRGPDGEDLLDGTGFSRMACIAVAYAITAQSDAGLECYQSDATIAWFLGVTRDHVGRIRRLLVSDGVFAERGGRGPKGTAVLRVNIPQAGSAPTAMARQKAKTPKAAPDLPEVAAPEVQTPAPEPPPWPEDWPILAQDHARDHGPDWCEACQRLIGDKVCPQVRAWAEHEHLRGGESYSWALAEALGSSGV